MSNFPLIGYSSIEKTLDVFRILTLPSSVRKDTQLAIVFHLSALHPREILFVHKTLGKSDDAPHDNRPGRRNPARMSRPISGVTPIRSPNVWFVIS